MKGKPAFSDARAAVDFVAAAVENNEWEKLYNACAEPSGDPEYFRGFFGYLQRFDQATPLRRLHAQAEFPADQTQYKLGGHGDEWGHIHIDFVKIRGQWYLDKIWQCR